MQIAALVMQNLILPSCAGPMRNLKRRWESYNDPKLLPKYLRHAERVARELGVIEDVRAFDEAAKAFPNAPPLVAAT